MRNLIFEEITLENFRLHEYLTFSFIPNRFVTVTGNNGSGKTTIISALTWAAYDVTCDGIKGDKIVRKRTGKNTRVVVTWTDGNDRYRIEAHRKHHKYKNKRILFKNDNDISCNTEAETLKLIEDLIMPKDVFMNCLLFSQFVKNSFTDLPYAGQREIIDQMLLLKCFDDYYENTANLIKQAGEELATLNHQIISNTSQCESTEQIIAREESTLEEALQRLQSQIDLAVEQATQLKEQYKSLNGNKLKETQNEVNNNAVKVGKNIAELESKIERQRELCQSELNELRSRLNSELQTKLSKVESEYNSIIDETKDKINQLKNEISSHEQHKTEILRKIEQKLNEIKQEKKSTFEKAVFPVNENKQVVILNILKIEDEMTSMQSDLSKANMEKVECDKSLEKENPNCPTCGQGLKTKTALAKIQTLSKVLKDNISELSNSLELKSEERARLEEELKEFDIKINKLGEEYQQELQKVMIAADRKIHEVELTCEESVSKVNITLKGLQNKYELNCKNRVKENQKLESEYEQLKVSKEKEIKQKHLNEANSWINKLAEFKKEQANLTTVLDEINKTLQKIDSISNELAGLKSKVEELTNSKQRSKEEHQSRIISLRKRIEESKEKCDEFQINVNALSRRIRILEFWKKGFSDTGIKAILLDETVPILNERARELCAIVPVLRVKFDSQTQLKSGESRNKFAIDVLHTKNLSSKEELSAGEKRMTDIIVLMCLRHLLEKIQDTRINILLLDEILDSLDPENAATVVGMVKEMSTNHCVVLISHTLRDFIEADESLQM